MAARSTLCPTCSVPADTVSEACVPFSNGHVHALTVRCTCGWQGVDLRPTACVTPAGVRPARPGTGV